MSFIDLLESEIQNLQLAEAESEELDLLCLLELDQEEAEELREELGLTVDEYCELLENTVRRVSSTGKVSRVATRKRRSRNATRTTGMSKSDRKRRARKAARTKKRSPGSMKRAVRKRKKALRKRKSLGI